VKVNSPNQMVASRTTGVLASSPFFARIWGKTGNALASDRYCIEIDHIPSGVIPAKRSVLDIKFTLIRLYPSIRADRVSLTGSPAKRWCRFPGVSIL